MGVSFGDADSLGGATDTRGLDKTGETGSGAGGSGVVEMTRGGSSLFAGFYKNSII